MKKISIILLLLFLSSPLIYAFDIKNVAAYPVPFDPRKGVMTIDDPGDPFTADDNVQVTIFDINGDMVRVVSGNIWNGRRSNGEYVKPGLYILKVEIYSKLLPPDPQAGGYWKKLIRILVKY